VVAGSVEQFTRRKASGIIILFNSDAFYLVGEEFCKKHIGIAEKRDIDAFF